MPFPDAVRAPPRHTQLLPFVVRPSHGDHDLERVARLRVQAYGRHLPAFAARLRTPEAADVARDTLVLLAEDKLDGRLLGSVRLQLGLARGLPLEASVPLPAWLTQDGPRVEPTRLVIEAGLHGPLVRNALFKACYLQARRAGANWLVAAARAPLDRLYQRLLFRDVFDDALPRPMRHIGDLPHRVLALPLREVVALYRATDHGLTGFMLDTDHPDLIVDAAGLGEQVASRCCWPCGNGPPDAGTVCTVNPERRPGLDRLQEDPCRERTAA